MMWHAQAFDILRSALEKAGIRYAIGGSWASTVFGEPRFSNDADILWNVTQQNRPVFLSHFPEDRAVSFKDTGLWKGPAWFVTPDDTLLAKLY